MSADVAGLSPQQLARCFEGVIPAVVATASADGTPNITYLSRVQLVDAERVALSNQFFSKTARNLAENPRASLLLIDPTTFDQYRLTIAYERTERRGPVFERLKTDVDALAALEGMQDVFKLRAADIYRVLHIELTPAAHRGVDPVELAEPDAAPPDPALIAEMTARLARASDLDTLVTTTIEGLDDLFGYSNSMVLLLDEEGRHLYTIASRGYAAEGVGSEIAVGEGLIGMAAARCAPLRVGNLRHMSTYSRSVRRSFEDHGDLANREIPMPQIIDVQSRVAVPCVSLGQLVGVIVVESAEPVAFTAADEAVLSIVASVFASVVEAERAQEGADDIDTGRDAAVAARQGAAAHVRFFEADGSTFLDGDYLIKGVAGRILWALLGHYTREGRVDFTNREVRLDPSLDLPPFRDNFESRLILLKRRLDERQAPVRVEKTGRGRFRLVVDGPLDLEQG